jgi:hypothetical protein
MAGNGSKNKVSNHLLFAGLIILLLCSAANAQVVQTGIIDGLVLDDQSFPVGGVFITISSSGVNAQKFSTISDFEGIFRVPGLPPGIYRIEADLEGYTQKENLRIDLRVNQVQRVVVYMVEGQISPQKAPDLPRLNRSIYSKPFLEELEYLDDNLHSTPFRTMDSIWTRSGLHFLQNRLWFEEMPEYEIEILIDDIRLNLPSSAKVPAATDLVPLSSMRLQSPDSDPSNPFTLGRVSLSSYDSNTALNGAVLAGVKNDFLSSSENLTKSESFRVGAIFSRGFLNDNADITLIVQRQIDKGQRTINPLDSRHNEDIFAQLRTSVPLGATSQLEGRYLRLDTRDENANSPSLNEWSTYSSAEDSGDVVDETIDLLGFRYKQRLSENILISYQAEYSQIRLANSPMSQNREISSVKDEKEGVLVQGSFSGEWNETDIERITGEVNLAFFLDEITGTHQIKLGIEGEYADYSNQKGFNGQRLIHQRGEQNVFSQYYLDHEGAMTNPLSKKRLTRFSLFAEDNWLIYPQLMVDIGIRFDGTDIENSTTRVINWKSVSPRLSLNYDIFNDGRMILRAGAGRYYSPARFDWAMPDPYLMVLESQINNSIAPSKLVARYGYDGDFLPGNTESDPPETDEYFAVFEFTPWSTFSLQTSVIHRKSRKIVEDMDYFFDQSGLVSIGKFAGFTESLAYDSDGNPYPFYSRIADGSGSVNPLLYWGNDDKLTRTYDAFSVSIAAQPLSKVYLQARYKWSSSRGNIDVTSEDFSSFSDIQNTPDRFYNADGYLSNHQRHLVRLLATFYLPFDLNSGLQFRYASGRPYNRLLYNPDSYSQTYEIFADPRGDSYNFDSLFTVDLYAEKKLVIGMLSLWLRGEITNLFDQVTAISVDQRDGPGFATPTAYSLPRNLKLNVVLNF